MLQILLPLLQSNADIQVLFTAQSDISYLLQGLSELDLVVLTTS